MTVLRLVRPVAASNTSDWTIEHVALDVIDTCGGTQMRTRTDDATVEEYRSRMMAGDMFPAIELVRDGAKYWLVDGFHRFRAARALGLETLESLVIEGDRSKAVLFATASNRTNGLPRTIADKRMAVAAALNHADMRRWSDRQIADHVGVSHTMVAKVRAGEVATGNVASSPPARTGRDGKSRKAPAAAKEPTEFDADVAAKDLRNAIIRLIDRWPDDRHRSASDVLYDLADDVQKGRVP